MLALRKLSSKVIASAPKAFAQTLNVGKVESFRNITTNTRTWTNPSSINLIANRQFSTGSSLAEVLTEEIASEAANDEIDQELVDITKQIKKSFTIDDEAGLGVVKLHRTYKGETIEVFFDCQDEVEDESLFNDMDMESAEETDEAEGTEGMMGLNFDVVIKKSSGEKVIFNCIASRDLQISNIQHVPNGKDVEDSDLYSGPIFSELDESVQDAMKSYLADRQIDEDLCYFVLSFARAKEQREYTNWLNQLLTFVEKK